MRKIRLFIVDDEPMSVEYFKSLLKRESEYEIIGEAFDGRTAYRMIKGKKPDIIFADISMPVMDGLELAEKLLNEDKSQKIILLTSYKDFDYARKGLEIGVVSYLLKHQISAGVLVQEIEKTMEKVRSHRDAEQKLLQFNLRKFLLSGEDPKEELTECLYHRGEEFLLMTAVPNTPILPEKHLQIQSCPKIEELENEESGSLHCRSLFEIERGKWTALIYLPSGQSRLRRREELMEFAHRMQAAVSESGHTASVVISEAADNFYRLPSIYQNHCKAAQRLYVYKRGTVVFQSEIPAIKSFANDDLSHISVRLQRDLEMGEDMAHQLIAVILEQAQTMLILKEYQEIVLDIITAILFFAQNRKLNFQAEEEECYSAKEAEDYIFKLLQHLFLFMREEQNAGYSSIIRKAIYYISVNYMNNISLADMAEYCSVSESYLRKCFKQETKSTVVDYLTLYRIEKSKKLLGQECSRVVEVYRAVGFTSSQYFGSVFKKVEGISPSEYKKKLFEPEVFYEQKEH